MTLNQGILYYLLVLNFGTFLLFWADKQKAVHRKWRIKEATLLGRSGRRACGDVFVSSQNKEK